MTKPREVYEGEFKDDVRQTDLAADMQLEAVETALREQEQLAKSSSGKFPDADYQAGDIGDEELPPEEPPEDALDPDPDLIGPEDYPYDDIWPEVT